MADRDSPSLALLLLGVAAIPLAGLALYRWAVDAGHCVATSVGDECFIFRDDRWDALLAAAVGVGALAAIRFVRAGALVADADRPRVLRSLWVVVALAFVVALWVGFGARAV